MKHRVSKTSEADIVSREHLVRLLVEQIERTFTLEGQSQALQQLAAMLRSLDEAALRALVYRQGLQDEDELMEPGEDRGPADQSEE